ncbi:MAG: thioredoxin [Candidatus Theseobacter exili]|nr:thioredoxin [Candidatus Theseobacter exili]
MTLRVNDKNFEQEVLKSEIPVLVDFWAPWCGPCQMVGPIIEEIAMDYAGKVKFCKMNVDEAFKTASQYGVMSIPTITLFKNGETLDKIIGALPKVDIEKFINHNM